MSALDPCRAGKPGERQDKQVDAEHPGAAGEPKARTGAIPMNWRFPLRVKRVGFVMSPVCPVYPKQQTFPDPVDTSHLCQNQTIQGMIRARRSKSSWDRCHTRLTLLDYESIIGLRGRISRVLGLMHNAGGDIIGLSSRQSFPFSSILARNNGPLDHRPVFVAGCVWRPVLTPGGHSVVISVKTLSGTPVTGASETSMLTLTCCASADADARNKTVAQIVGNRRITASLFLR